MPAHFVLLRLNYLLIAIFLQTSVFAGGTNSEIIEEPNDDKTHSLYTYFKNWTDWISWKAPPEITQSYKYYRCGYDDDGRIVYVIEFGRANYRDLGFRSREFQKKYWMYHEQGMRWIEMDSKRNNYDGVVLIFDFDGFSLSHFASSNGLQTALRSMTYGARLSKSINYGFIINVNYPAETFITMAKPFLGTFLEKFELYGTMPDKWKPILLKKIPKDQLPPAYGGSSDWKPLPRGILVEIVD